MQHRKYYDLKALEAALDGSRFLTIPYNPPALLQRDAPILRPLLDPHLEGRDRRADRDRGAEDRQDPIVRLDLMDAEGQLLRIANVA